MFKGMPKIFWVGMAVMYGWCFFFIIIEMHVPGFPLKKFMGVPACYIYNWIFALWLVNIFVSYIFYKFEEKREEKQEILHEIETKLSEENVPQAIQEGFKKVIANM